MLKRGYIILKVCCVLDVCSRYSVCGCGYVCNQWMKKVGGEREQYMYLG